MRAFVESKAFDDDLMSILCINLMNLLPTIIRQSITLSKSRLSVVIRFLVLATKRPSRGLNETIKLMTTRMLAGAVWDGAEETSWRVFFSNHVWWRKIRLYVLFVMIYVWDVISLVALLLSFLCKTDVIFSETRSQKFDHKLCHYETFTAESFVCRKSCSPEMPASFPWHCRRKVKN